MKKVVLFSIMLFSLTSCFKYAKKLDDRAIEKLSERQKEIEAQKNKEAQKNN